MKLTIIAPGSQGDVRPFLALGKELQDTGHQVRVATQQSFAELAKGCGLVFYPLHDDMETLLRDPAVRAAVSKNNPLAQLRLMKKKLVVLNEQWMRDCLEACLDADLVTGGFGALMAGQPVAEKLHIPFIQAWLAPFTPTHAFPATSFPQLRKRFGGRLNRRSHVLGWRLLAWPMQRATINLARRKVLELPPAPYWDGPLAYFKDQTWPVLNGFSQHVVPRPEDWPAHHHVTGYWFLDPPSDWRPQPALVDFLKAGPPPVYIGFGSMSHADPQAATRLVLEALQISGQRGILLAGWGGLTSADLPSSVTMVEAVPHAWLFPQVKAVVHHGGAGTTAAGLRAGKPTLCVPFISLDQGFWGWRVADLGVGPPPIPSKQLNAEKLAQAITTLVSDPNIQQHAAEIGDKIRGENGAAEAAALFV
jgi:sterol 3beta-glucosyltransferase